MSCFWSSLIMSLLNRNASQIKWNKECSAKYQVRFPLKMFQSFLLIDIWLYQLWKLDYACPAVISNVFTKWLLVDLSETSIICFISFARTLKRYFLELRNYSHTPAVSNNEKCRLIFSLLPDTTILVLLKCLWIWIIYSCESKIPGNGTRRAFLFGDQVVLIWNCFETIPF
jgi:hypothetical protein